MAFLFLALATVGFYSINGPLFAIIQSLIPEHMRAMSIALVLLAGNLIGMGLGPLAAGMLSDFFHAWAGQESLRYALLALCPGYLWTGWHLWHASKTVRNDLKDV
jgi:MFS family permease